MTQVTHVIDVWVSSLNGLVNFVSQMYLWMKSGVEAINDAVDIVRSFLTAIQTGISSLMAIPWDDPFVSAGAGFVYIIASLFTTIVIIKIVQAFL